MNGSTADGGARILRSLRSVDGTGLVRLECVSDTDIDDLWSALTDPARLGRWLGDVQGDLRLGGEFRAHFLATGWEGTGRVEECEPPHRLLVLTQDEENPADQVTEATLSAVGARTTLVIEQRSLPLAQLAEYGAGLQVHVEDLIAHLGDAERCDPLVRWKQLLPPYQDLAADLR
jgi:uncharacterized protein YndB with AHSA1/START domain